MAQGRNGKIKDKEFTVSSNDEQIAKNLPLTVLLKSKLDEVVQWTDQDGNQQTSTVREAIVAQLVTKAVNGNEWAMKEVWDRVEGKSLQNLNIGGEVPKSLAELIHLGMNRGEKTNKG